MFSLTIASQETWVSPTRGSRMRSKCAVGRPTPTPSRGRPNRLGMGGAAGALLAVATAFTTARVLATARVLLRATAALAAAGVLPSAGVLRRRHRRAGTRRRRVGGLTPSARHAAHRDAGHRGGDEDARDVHIGSLGF